MQIYARLVLYVDRSGLNRKNVAREIRKLSKYFFLTSSSNAQTHGTRNTQTNLNGHSALRW